MINVRILSNGNLLFTADNFGRAALSDAYHMGGYPRAESDVFSEIEPAWRAVAPEAIGALTDAPIVCAEAFQPMPDDSGESYDVDPEAVFYWFPDYAIRDPWEELKNSGRVIFQRAA